MVHISILSLVLKPHSHLQGREEVYNLQKNRELTSGLPSLFWVLCALHLLPLSFMCYTEPDPALGVTSPAAITCQWGFKKQCMCVLLRLVLYLFGSASQVFFSADTRYVLKEISGFASVIKGLHAAMPPLKPKQAKPVLV